MYIDADVLQIKLEHGVGSSSEEISGEMIEIIDALSDVQKKYRSGEIVEGFSDEILRLIDKTDLENLLVRIGRSVDNELYLILGE